MNKKPEYHDADSEELLDWVEVLDSGVVANIKKGMKKEKKKGMKKRIRQRDRDERAK
jgi:hypothetical protein